MDEAKTQTVQTYKSPLKKLVRFFEQSRDKWKAKSHAAKADVVRLEHRVRFLEKGKAELRSHVKELEAEVARLKTQVQSGAPREEATQKKGASKREK